MKKVEKEICEHLGLEESLSDYIKHHPEDKDIINDIRFSPMTCLLRTDTYFFEIKRVMNLGHLVCHIKRVDDKPLKDDELTVIDRHAIGGITYNHHDTIIGFDAAHSFCIVPFLYLSKYIPFDKSDKTYYSFNDFKQVVYDIADDFKLDVLSETPVFFD